MASQDGQTVSSWWDGIDVPRFDVLDGDRSCDVCVIGAGIAGLSVAYHLCRAGKKVVVVDDSQIGDGQTGRTSAHLSSEWDDRYLEAERALGAQASAQIYDSHSKAIDTIEEISKRESINCDFTRVDGWLFLGPNDKDQLLLDELAAAKRAGFFDAEHRDSLNIGGRDFGRALRFPRQAYFHPLKYLVGLAKFITSHGGEIFCGDRVTDVQGIDPKSNDPAKATTQSGPVVSATDGIAVCTNTPAPINDWMGIYTKQAAYRTYVIAARIAKGSVPAGLYWDTLDPYHYIRTQPMPGDAKAELLLIGGEDHKTGQPPASAAPFLALERWGRDQFPAMQEVLYKWSGQVQEPNDSVAFIGRAPHAKQAIYVATGDSGMGLTHGTIAGMLISDQILGKTSPWESLYDPSRKPLGASTEFAKENLNAVEQYTKYFTGGEVSSVDEVAAGTGAIIRRGLKKVAVYRDEADAVYEISPVCTHLGCVVSWNPVEKTWDCPCHGARYDAQGHVIMGPAISDLARVDREV